MPGRRLSRYRRLVGERSAAGFSPSLSAGPAVLLRLFVGNLVLPAVLGVAGYVLALRFVRVLWARDVELLEPLAPEA